MFDNLPRALNVQAFEGAFAQCPGVPFGPNGNPPYPSSLGMLQAGTAPDQSGVALGRFGWYNPNTGLVLNTRTTAEDQIGVTLPQCGCWERIYFNHGVRYIRTGKPLTLITAGPFYLRFAGGAYAGQPVYASLDDGTASSGPITNSELTSWLVTSNCSPGQLAIISSTAKFP